MSEYWGRRFAQEGMIWGSDPSPTALIARDLFRQHKVTSVLVPGAGYGRNTKVFSMHLFLQKDRRRLVANCLELLRPGGLLYFTCFSNQDPNNGCGRLLEPGTYEYKEGKYAHFFSEDDLREHFEGTEIVETGPYSEKLPSPEGGTHQYILRYIIARKMPLQTKGLASYGLTPRQVTFSE
ncbi:class I SAM-dependent methyltransferase [Paenibacillus sp. BR2-3]|uniref:class I SAM-dependent methyltransferase n=1 Tax=Paenibacillus sp. BR2-3 TaxID=3048494 RepID=UPI003977C6F3